MAEPTGFVPADVPEGSHAPAHSFPAIYCPRCTAVLVPWGTLLVGDRSLVVLHCGDHPAADRLWDERKNADCGLLRDAKVAR